jgi:hypothetical protein
MPLLAAARLGRSPILWIAAALLLLAFGLRPTLEAGFTETELDSLAATAAQTVSRHRQWPAGTRP